MLLFALSIITQAQCHRKMSVLSVCLSSVVKHTRLQKLLVEIK